MARIAPDQLLNEKTLTLYNVSGPDHANTLSISTGVAIFAIEGTNEHGAVGHEVAFPVGPAFSPGDLFKDGSAIASLAGLTAPHQEQDVEVRSVGSATQNGSVSTTGTGRVIDTRVGWGLDSARVEYDAASARAVLVVPIFCTGFATQVHRLLYQVQILGYNR